MIRIEWPQTLPSYLDPVPADLPKGCAVHHSLWSDKGTVDKVCIGENLLPADVVKIVSGPSCKSLIQYNADWFHRDLKTSLEIRKDADAYFKNAGTQLLGGVEQSWTWDFSRREEKYLVKDRLLSVASGTEAMRESLNLIFEELFMNAIIDAPREAEKRGVRPKNNSSTMTLTKFGNRVCLSARDPYGTLKIPKFIGRMDQVYSQGAGNVINLQSDRGGAGLGCVLLFEHSTLLALGVEDANCTVVSCVVPTGLNRRQKDSVRKGLHWIETGVEKATDGDPKGSGSIE